MKKLIILTLGVLLTFGLASTVSADTESEFFFEDVKNPDISIESTYFGGVEDPYEGDPDVRVVNFSLEGENGGVAGGSFTTISDSEQVVEGGFTGREGDFESSFSTYARSSFGNHRNESEHSVNASGVSEKELIEDPELNGNTEVGGLTVIGKAKTQLGGSPYNGVQKEEANVSFWGEAESAEFSAIERHDYTKGGRAASVEADIENGEAPVNFSGGGYTKNKGLSFGTWSEGNLNMQAYNKSYSFSDISQDSNAVWGEISTSEGTMPEVFNYDDE